MSLGVSGDFWPVVWLSLLLLKTALLGWRFRPEIPKVHQKYLCKYSEV